MSGTFFLIALLKKEFRQMAANDNENTNFVSNIFNLTEILLIFFSSPLNHQFNEIAKDEQQENILDCSDSVLINWCLAGY